jgi:hypothetical protein
MTLEIHVLENAQRSGRVKEDNGILTLINKSIIILF